MGKTTPSYMGVCGRERVVEGGTSAIFLRGGPTHEHAIT